MFELQPTMTNTFLDEVDARIKFLYVLQILIIIVITNNLRLLATILVLSILTYVFVNGVKTLIGLLWSLKWYFIGFYVIGVFLIGSIENNTFIEIAVKFLILFLSFVVFSQTTNPDQITDILMKFRLPSKIAWSIGTTLRQVYFVFDEITNIRQIHQKLNKDRGRIELFSTVLTSIYANSIRRSMYFAKVLDARGFEEAHKDIITLNQTFKINDIFYFILSLIPSVIYFIYRSQLFI